jgi:hypothetical protein
MNMRLHGNVVQAAERLLLEVEIHRAAAAGPDSDADCFTCDVQIVANAAIGLTADLAALERDNARLRATLERAADLSRVSYYDRAACGLCKRFEGHEHDCPFAALSPERPGDAGTEGR